MERKQRMEEVEKEFAWINEKENLGLQKIKSKFLDPIKTERIVISSFNVNFYLNYLIFNNSQRDSVSNSFLLN